MGRLALNGYPIESVLLLNTWNKEPLNNNATNLAQIVADAKILNTIGMTINPVTLEITTL